MLPKMAAGRYCGLAEVAFAVGVHMHVLRFRVWQLRPYKSSLKIYISSHSLPFYTFYVSSYEHGAQT